MSTAFHWATFALYVAGAFVYLGFLFRQRRGLHTMGQAMLWAGFGLHTIALAAAWIETGALPAMSLRQSLDVFSWALMGGMLLVNLRVKVLMLGAVAAPVCALLLLAASVLPQPTAQPGAALKSLWVVAHVITVLFGYGFLALTFIGGLLYLIQDKLIRGKNLGPVFQRLPSLSRLDALNGKSLMAGFTLLTVGLILGAAYAQITLGSYWRWDPKEVWSLITWLMYAALLHSRLVKGWGGRRGAWLAVAAFVALMFTFLGAGLLMPGYHNLSTIPTFTGTQP